MRNRLILISLMTLLAGCAGENDGDLESRLTARIEESEAEVVGLYFKNLATGDSLLINAGVRMHAASMMKVPVLIQLYRDAAAGMFSLDDSLTVTSMFESIVDGSPYELSAPDDTEGTLYGRIGERESIRQLAELMITVSSNLAANMLVELVDAKRAQRTMRELGADSIEVLRGVEDIKAYEAGLSNTTTARDLGVIFSAIAEATVADLASSDEMIAILSRQEFKGGIPAGLPASTWIAHKTGSITEIRHDGGIVYIQDGTSYVLVVLTKGIENPADADRLIADISRVVYEHVATARGLIDGAAEIESTSRPMARIAITVDDLPWNGPVPAEGLKTATDRLLSALVEHDAPAVGFVRCAGLSESGGELLAWRDRGMVLGNHTTGHRDLNSAPLDGWLDDVRSCDDALRAATGGPVRYFRFPMLHRGLGTERRDAALTLLNELGYQIAPVSVDNSEYLVGRPFDAALAAGDVVEQDRLGGLFVEHMLAMVGHAQGVALRKLGRNVDHILLLHASALVAYNLGALLDALEDEGFAFISLEEALQDPAYELPDVYVGPKGLSWLYRIEPLTEEDVDWDDMQAEQLRARLVQDERS